MLAVVFSGFLQVVEAVKLHRKATAATDEAIRTLGLRFKVLASRLFHWTVA